MVGESERLAVFDFELDLGAHNELNEVERKKMASNDEGRRAACATTAS